MSFFRSLLLVVMAVTPGHLTYAADVQDDKIFSAAAEIRLNMKDAAQSSPSMVTEKNDDSSAAFLLSPMDGTDVHFLEDFAHASLTVKKFLSECYVNGVVAIVNGRVITAGELQQMILHLVPSLEATVRSREEFEERMKVLLTQALEEMITHVLIVQEFQKLGMQLSKKQKEFQLDDFIHSRFSGDRILFMEQLRAYGKSLQQFKREMEESFIVGWMMNRFHHSRSEISPSQIRNYYDAHLEEFLVPAAVRIGQLYFSSVVENEEGEMTENPQIAGAIARLESGDTFADVAHNYSQKSIPEEEEWVSLDDLREELRNVVGNLPVGVHTSPIPIGNQVAIFCLYGRRDAQQRTIEEVQSFIEDILSRGQLEEAKQRWIQGLKDRAYVKIYLCT